MLCSKVFIELNKTLHNRSSFDCNEVELNAFIKQQAARHMASNISRTMVLANADQQHICAFYAIAPSSILRKQLPKTQAKKLPHYPIPVFLLAQLAVDKHYQGQGLGKITLIKALEHLYSINHHMRAYAVIVDCINKEAESFYSKFGFVTLFVNDNGRMRMYLPMKQLEKLFQV